MATETTHPSALILLAPGCEEMEAVITIDVLRRGGVHVVSAGLEGAGPLVASRDVGLVPDQGLDTLTDAKEFDVLILPGGMPGTEALRVDSRVRDLLLHYLNAPDKLVACICAAAWVLDTHGMLVDKNYTCYPTVAAKIEGGTWLDQPVVEDGTLISSQGPGTAFAFALTILERLLDKSTRDEVAAGLLLADH